MNAATLPAQRYYQLPTPGQDLRALLFAVLIHVLAGLLMFVGVWSSVQEPMIDAGDPLEAYVIDLSAGPLPKAAVKPTPAPPKPAPAQPKPAEVKPVIPKPEVDRKIEQGKLDDVTDQKVAPPKIDTDALARAEEEQRKEKLAEQKRIQLEEIRQQREQAEAERIKAENDLKKIQNAQAVKEAAAAKAEAARIERERIAARDAALRGTVQTDDLLAQWRNAVRQSIQQQWQIPTGTPAKLQCGIRITAIVGGEVGFRTIVEPCQLSPELQQTLLDAVDAANPLPYSGFESVFQRQISVLFVTPESN